uniref:Uncharacterized protein n=1 Tax=Anguilla anguilla TaxID=7936 RepID=A0A0E9TCH1_ANGAN
MRTATITTIATMKIFTMTYTTVQIRKVPNLLHYNR